MGTAALMIILCHAPQYGVEVSGLLRKFLVFLNLGVDIFLFLSGMGCYFSLTQSHGYFFWLKKRFLRIFIPYTIVLLTLRILGLLVDDVSWSEWLLYYSTLRFWTHHDGMWFVALLVLLYPLAPFIYQILNRSRRRALTAIILITLCLLITHIPIINASGIATSVITNLKGAFKHTICFIIGMYLAPYVKQNIKVNALYVIGVSALCCLLFHFLMNDIYYSWLYVLPTLLVLSICFEQIPRFSKINVFFLWLGAASLESYLANVGIKALLPKFLNPWINNQFFTGHYLDYSIVIISGFILTYISKSLSKRITAKLL